MQDVNAQKRLPLLDLHPQSADFLSDASTGLRQSPKRLSPMYFYDAAGSKLFERICELEEYYPTRTEVSILRRYRRELGLAIGAQTCLIELGSGSSSKTGIVLEAVRALHSYVPIDISKQHLRESAERIASDFPSLGVLPVCADFLGELRLPAEAEEAQHKCVWFPGSTIGNLNLAVRRRLLDRIHTLCQPQGGGLLIGIDLQKDQTVLERAYNDAAGITAAFNLNLLERMNRELGADFDTTSFAHRAFYNDEEQRIEMHLESRKAQEVTLDGDRIGFTEGETVCTEYSYKFTVDGFCAEASGSGFTLQNAWTDPNELFAVLLLRC
jgi:dimethylhistidine N-methyltransferase